MTIEFRKNDTKRKHNLSRFKTRSYFLSLTIGRMNSRTESAELSTAETRTGRCGLRRRIFVARVSHGIVLFCTKLFRLNIRHASLDVDVSFLHSSNGKTLLSACSRRKSRRGNRTEANVWILHESVGFFFSLSVSKLVMDIFEFMIYDNKLCTT